MTPRVSVVLGVFEGAEVLDETLARPLCAREGSDPWVFPGIGPLGVANRVH